MKEKVDSYLKNIGCKPNEYYNPNGNSEVCFVCEDADACFGYVWVQKTGGEKMNPKGAPSLKTESEVE